MLNAIDSNNLIVFTQVGKSFSSPQEIVLTNVSFAVKEHEFVSIVGPSGCGKSTVLKLIADLEKPSSGTIQKPKEIAMDFQSGALFPWLTVYENVAFGLRAQGLALSTIRQRVEEQLEMIGLVDYAYKYPAELSGGQRQRVGIARALAVKPKVLLLDEPFSALDPKTMTELHHDLLSLWKKTNITIVMVSHLIEEAVSLADRIILMKQGSIIKEFPITLPYPRREQAVDYMHHVQDVRKYFFE